jgi:lipoprotein-releasing system permease protein
MGLGVSAVPMLARRFLLSKSSGGFLSFISWVSVVGIALGVLALTVVTSVINGFEGELVRVITGMNGDLVLYSRGEAIRDPDAVIAKVKTVLPQVQAVTPSFVMELMVSGPTGVRGSIIEGIDAKTVGEVTAIPERVVAGRIPGPDEDGVAVASALAERIGVQVGSDLRLVIPFTESTDPESKELSSSPKVLTAKVVGIVKMGLYDYDSKYVFAPLAFVQKFFDQPGRVTSFKMRLAPGSDSRAASDRLADNFGAPFRAKDWSQMNRNLFYAIRLEKVVISIILTVIVIVAAFNVISTLMMMIHDKTKEISILKAMGFTPSQSFSLFCLVGVGMGVVGTTFGVGMGLGVNAILARTHWIDLPADIYSIGFLPVVIRWKEVGLIALISMLISFTATCYPAWRVARRSPLDGIRYE